MTYKDILDATLSAMNPRNIEIRPPKPGFRHNSKTLYVRHRFPVKGGINQREHIELMLSDTNPLFSVFSRPK